MPPRRNNDQSISRKLWNDADTSYGGLLRAILYELQPIRLSQLRFQFWVTRIRESVKYCLICLRDFISWNFRWIRDEFSFWHAKCLTGVALYYALVRLVHTYLDAGPVFLMTTALGLIFTVGLADNSDKGEPGRRQLSAYHVFNRGMQRMMGDLDADELLAQHVGGIFFNGNRHEEGNGDRPIQRAQAQEHGNNNNDNADDIQADAAPQQGAARRSRKKARGEQRREIHRQCQAAIAAIGDDDDDEDDALALQQVIEAQAADRHNL
jgi:hypothetical protein